MQVKELISIITKNGQVVEPGHHECFTVLDSSKTETLGFVSIDYPYVTYKIHDINRFYWDEKPVEVKFSLQEIEELHAQLKKLANWDAEAS